MVERSSSLDTAQSEPDFWLGCVYVSPHAIIDGPVTLGGGCVVLAGAVIRAAAGFPIVLGPYCLVEEYTVITTQSDSWEAAAVEETPLSIGGYNHWEPRSEARGVGQVGSGNRFLPFSVVCGNRQSKVGDHCVVGPYVCLRLFSSAPLIPLSPQRWRPMESLPSHSVALRRPVPPHKQLTSSPAATVTINDVCVMPLDGSRSVAELPLLAASMMATPEGPASVVATTAATTTDPSGATAGPSTPPLGEEEAHEITADGAVVSPWLEAVQAQRGEGMMERVRKRCRYYLQHSLLNDGKLDSHAHHKAA